MHQRRLLVAAVITLLALSGSQGAHALVIQFDDITTNAFGDVPLNYQGLTWSDDWIVLSDYANNAFYGNSYTSPSGETPPRMEVEC